MKVFVCIPKQCVQCKEPVKVKEILDDDKKKTIISECKNCEVQMIDTYEK